MLPATTSSTPVPRVALQVEAMTKRFGPLVAVDAISLEVRAGEILGLLGPNGAGKTTLLSMICGRVRPDGGRALLDGELLAGGSRIGVCPQEIVIWKQLGCLEQLEFVGRMYGLSASIARERGGRLLEALGLSEKARARAATLSGGMQRRLNLALGLVHDPELVVLDEPEAGLDPQSRVLVRDFIRGLARRKTVLLTSHNMDEVERTATRVAIMDRGRLLAQGSPGELKKAFGGAETLELALAPPPGDSGGPGDLCARLRALAEEVTPSEDAVLLRGRNLLGRVHEVLDIVRATGAQVREVRMRESTLEDVFIALTGRRLRE